MSAAPPQPEDMITTVVIDEVHNRSAHSDYVLASRLFSGATEGGGSDLPEFKKGVFQTAVLDSVCHGNQSGPSFGDPRPKQRNPTIIRTFEV